MPIVLATLLLGGCVASDQSFQTAAQVPGTAPPLRQAPPNTSGAAPVAAVAPAAAPQAAETGLLAGLDRWGRAVAAAVRPENGVAPVSAESAGAAPPAAADPQRRGRQNRALATRQADTAPGETGSVPGAAAARAAIAYEQAMLRRDPRSMARAAARLTKKPVSESSLRDLNAQLGIEADEETIAAVVRAAR